MKKILLLFLAVIALILNSCTKDDDLNAKKNTDIRDEYVGDWNISTIGSYKVIKDGTVLTTESLDNKTYGTITKSGSDKLIIGDRIFYVYGNSLTSEPLNDTRYVNGVSVSITTKTSGTLYKDIIILKSLMEGTWKSDNNEYGTVLGSASLTLTRK